MVVIAAVDRSEKSADVMRETESIADAFDEPIHVVHVLSQSEFVDLGRTRADSGDSFDIDDIRDVAEDIAAEAASAVDVPTELIGLMGDPAEEVVQYATEQDARYIVVTGRKRSPAGKILFGSVAQSILLNAPCPVVSTIHH